MTKPSEIFNTPEATSRVRGNEEVVKYFCNELTYRLTPSNEAMKVIRYARLELTELLTTKDQEKEEAEKRIEEYLRQLVHTLHKEFCFTGLATEEQWNEGVSPKLKALANVIRGYSPDSPTARVYKFPALPTEDNN